MTAQKEVKMKNLLLTMCLLVLYPVFETQAEEDPNPEHWILSVPFQRIEAGSFTMGSPWSERHRGSDEKQVQVTITRPFEIMIYEVTQSQWVKMMRKNPSRFRSKKYCDDHKNNMCPNHPVEQVSWYDVQEFIGKLNKALGLKGCDGTPDSAKGCYRLPTEAEWEYAARAGTTTPYSFDGGDHYSAFHLEKFAWYDYNSGHQTHKVGLKQPNPWGLYDTHGNVWEWVEDTYAKKLPGGEDPLNTFRLWDSLSAQEPLRIIRGGSWYNFYHTLRVANRIDIDSIIKFRDIGFRLVRTL